MTISIDDHLHQQRWGIPYWLGQWPTLVTLVTPDMIDSAVNEPPARRNHGAVRMRRGA